MLVATSWAKIITPQINFYHSANSPHSLANQFSSVPKISAVNFNYRTEKYIKKNWEVEEEEGGELEGREKMEMKTISVFWGSKDEKRRSESLPRHGVKW